MNTAPKHFCARSVRVRPHPLWLGCVAGGGGSYNRLIEPLRRWRACPLYAYSVHDTRRHAALRVWQINVLFTLYFFAIATMMGFAVLCALPLGTENKQFGND